MLIKYFENNFYTGLYRITVNRNRIELRVKNRVKRRVKNLRVIWESYDFGELN